MSCAPCRNLWKMAVNCPKPTFLWQALYANSLCQMLSDNWSQTCGLRTSMFLLPRMCFEPLLEGVRRQEALQWDMREHLQLPQAHLLTQTASVCVLSPPLCCTSPLSGLYSLLKCKSKQTLRTTEPHLWVVKWAQMWGCPWMWSVVDGYLWIGAFPGFLFC